MAGGGVEDDGRQAEAALDRASLGVDMLDAGGGDQGAGHGEPAVLEIDFRLADLVPPTTPAQVGSGPNAARGEDHQDEGDDGDGALGEEEPTEDVGGGEGDRPDDQRFNDAGEAPRGQGPAIEMVLGRWAHGRAGFPKLKEIAIRLVHVINRSDEGRRPVHYTRRICSPTGGADHDLERAPIFDERL